MQHTVADERDSLSDETLIAYVRGRLPDADAARIAAEATRQPGLAAELALVRGLVGAADAEADSPVPGELGWARLSRALDAEPARPARRVGSRLWPLAAAAAAAVLVWQVVAVPIISGPRGGDARYAPVSEQAAAGSTASVAFVPTASEAAMRALLAEAGARISDGPSAIGLWQLSFADDAARDAGLLKLQAADIVESAQANE
jgi:anti-sigma factor RsiW